MTAWQLFVQVLLPSPRRNQHFRRRCGRAQFGRAWPDLGGVSSLYKPLIAAIRISARRVNVLEAHTTKPKQ